MTFEEIFKIPLDHTLKKTRERLKTLDDNWKHEEFDAQGQLVARYESWDYLTPGVSHNSGWRKVSPDGAVLEEHNDLPL